MTIADRCRFLESMTGNKSLSVSTLKRLLKRMGFSRKKRSVGAMERDEWLRAAWRVMVAAEIDARRLVFVDEMGTNTSLHSLYACSRRAQRACSARCPATAARIPLYFPA